MAPVGKALAPMRVHSHTKFDVENVSLIARLSVRPLPILAEIGSGKAS